MVVDDEVEGHRNGVSDEAPQVTFFAVEQKVSDENAVYRERT